MGTCYKAQRLFHIESKEFEALIKFTNYCEHFVPEFNAAGFFRINKSLIFSLSGHVAAYYIIYSCSVQSKSKCSKLILEHGTY